MTRHQNRSVSTTPTQNKSIDYHPTPLPARTRTPDKFRSPNYTQININQYTKTEPFRLAHKIKRRILWSAHCFHTRVTSRHHTNSIETNQAQNRGDLYLTCGVLCLHPPGWLIVLAICWWEATRTMLLLEHIHAVRCERQHHVERLHGTRDLVENLAYITTDMFRFYIDKYCSFWHHTCVHVIYPVAVMAQLRFASSR